jgi:hypothetical protein
MKHSPASIDALLKGPGWAVGDANAVRFEYTLPDGTDTDELYTLI